MTSQVHSQTPDGQLAGGTSCFQKSHQASVLEDLLFVEGQRQLGHIRGGPLRIEFPLLGVTLIIFLMHEGREVHIDSVIEHHRLDGQVGL